MTRWTMPLLIALALVVPSPVMADELVDKLLQQMEKRIDEMHRQLLAEFEEMVTQALRERGKAHQPRVSSPLDAVAGDWEMATQLGDNTIDAVMTLRVEEGKLTGIWKSQGQEMSLQGITLEGEKLRFEREMGQDMVLVFEGTVTGDKIRGVYDTPFGKLECIGKRAKPKGEKKSSPLDGHERPFVIGGYSPSMAKGIVAVNP